MDILRRAVILTTRKKVIVLSTAFLALLLYYVASIPVVVINPPLAGPCKIPKLDPWDSTVDLYMEDLPPIPCSYKHSLMYVDDNGVLNLNTSAVTEYQVTSLKCSYRIIERKTDSKLSLGPSLTFEPPIFIKGRVFRVTCTVSGATSVVYDFIHVNMVWNESAARQEEIGSETDNDLSIIFIGLDSVSRSHALRNLPLSMRYLKNTLGAVDFEGYMKVGSNSYPNLVPLLTGKSSTSMSTFSSFDDIDFIWKKKISRRYASHFSEDRPNIGIFTMSYKGFKYKPVDYYFRTYGVAMDETEPVIIEPLGHSTQDCYGNKQHVKLQIDYFKRFISKYRGRLKLGLFWNNQMSHERFSALQYHDATVLALLRWLHEGRHLDRTVLIVASDHGYRIDGFSTTHIGRLENNMPLLTVRLPPHLVAKHLWMIDRLQQNTQRLVTAYDIHVTLMQIINSNFERPKSVGVSRSLVARSLFSEIPKTRTCTDAGIPGQYCTCADMQDADTSSRLVRSLARTAVLYINKKLVEHNFNIPCHNLTLKNVTEAKVTYNANGDPDKVTVKQKLNLYERYFTRVSLDYSGRYVLLFNTWPGDALFQATIDYKKLADGKEETARLLSQPDRLDRYGEQAVCVKGKLGEQYCYCRNLKNKNSDYF